jgi:hypothetical protein
VSGCQVKYARHHWLTCRSMSSGSEVYSDVKVFLYPEFDIARLDGQLWRCERQALGEYVIKEKLGDATQPEWDGVGYAKE